MEQSTQTEEPSMQEIAKDIYAKLDNIQAVLGFILEKTKLIPEQGIINDTYINNLGFDVPENKILE